MTDNPTEKSSPTTTESTQEQQKNKTVYILITQCLQNGFFFADDSRLCLHEDIVARMLLHSTISAETDDEQATAETSKQTTPRDFITVKDNRRHIEKAHLEGGPLYQFLSTVMDNRKDSDTLHAIHLRDWHKPSRDYDVERELYGPHCEANTWQAQSLEGFETYLSPWGTGKADTDHSVKQQQNLPTELKQSFNNPHDLSNFITQLGGTQHANGSNVIHYPVLSDSVFDFRRSDTIIDETYENELRDKDEILSSVEPQTHQRPSNPIHRSPSYLETLINSILNIEQQQTQPHTELHVNIVVVGVYTDIKIRTLLTGLRSRYRIDNLVVSDVLTAAPSLERHIEALDFVYKVLQVEVVHSLNDLVSVLQPGADRQIPKELIKDHVNFRDYRSYYLNKQNLLAYQDTKRIEYLELTRTRSKAIYTQVYQTNKWLIRFGFAFLGLTIAFGVLYLISPIIPAILPGVIIQPEFWLLGSVVSGGLSLVQLFAVFFANPLNTLQDNLNNLIHLRSELETHSLILALLRYHFSTPGRLNEDYLEKGEAAMQDEIARLGAIEKQIQMIQSVDFDAKGGDKSAEITILERINQLKQNSNASDAASNGAG